jgi:hypothetical protein
MAMFDMPDYVYTGDGTRLDTGETPLGRWLVRAASVTTDRLRALKSFPLVRRRDATLVYLPGAARGLPLEQIRKLVEDLPLYAEGGG